MKGLRQKGRAVKIVLVAQFGGKCQRCGYDRCMRALQFHHTDDSEKAEWSKKSGRASQDEVAAHPERFLLLCANCHFEEHDRIDRENRLLATCRVCGCTFRTESHRGGTNRGNYCSRDCYGKDRHRVALAGVPDRLRKYIDKAGECLVWTGHCQRDVPVLNYPMGYRNNCIRPAARILWELERGPLDEKQQVWRTRDTPRCIRPEHQILGTRRSMMAGAGRARRIAAKPGRNAGESQGFLPI